MNTVRVKFGPVKAGEEHVHDGKICKPGTVAELPEDLADFVIAAGKAQVTTEDPANN